MKQYVALVTGGTGFTGAHLIRKLIASGWIVHAIIRPCSNLSQLERCIDQINVHAHDGSTSNMISIVNSVKPDMVFHLAALSMAQHTPNDLVSLLQSNIVFSTQLAEAMAENGVNKLVNSGTFWQYFDNKGYAPTCLYAATKQAFEAILQYYIDAKNFVAITLILFDSYGVNDTRLKLFNLLKESGRSRQPLLMSPGNQLIDMVYIDDVIEAFVLAAERLLEGSVKGHERFAVSSGDPINLKELVSLYEKICKVKLNIQWGGKHYRNREVMMPWSGGDCLPGWEPKVSLVDGIQSVVNGELLNSID